MSRGFSGAESAGRRYFYYSLWTLSALVLFYIFLRHHPPRPLFSTPGAPEGGPAPWLGNGASLLGGAISLVLLLPGGGALARLIGLEQKNLLVIPALGSLYAMAAAFILLSAGFFNVTALLAALLLPLAAWDWRRLPMALPSLRPPSITYDRILLALLGVALTAGLIRALAPLTGNDSLVYHMSVAAEYARSGSFHADQWNMYARTPHGIELLYAGAYLTGAEGAARMVHFLFYFGNILLAAMISRELTGRNGMGAALLFALTPLFLDPRTVGNADMGASLFFGLALYQILLFKKGGKRGDLAAAGLFAAGLLWVKYATWSAWPLLPAMLLLLPAARKKGTAPKEWLLFAAPSIAAALLWFGRAWLESGHPLFPLVVPPGNSAGWDSLLAGRLREWQMGMGMGRRLLDYLLLPWNVVMNGQPFYNRFDGVLSPLYLILLPLSLLFGDRRTRRLWALAAAGLLLWAIGPQQLRFLSPVILLACALLGDSWRHPEQNAGRRWIAYLPRSIFLIGTMAVAAPPLTQELRDTLPVVLGREGRESYLSRQIQSYDAFSLIERIVPSDQKVLLLWENRTYYSTRQIVCDSFFESSQVVRLAERMGSAGRFLGELKAMDIDWIVVNRPLQNVFARQYGRNALNTLEMTLKNCEPVGSWKGVELFRVPDNPGL